MKPEIENFKEYSPKEVAPAGTKCAACTGCGCRGCACVRCSQCGTEPAESLKSKLKKVA